MQRIVSSLKTKLVFITILIGCIYAAPNFYGEDPSIQVISKHRSIDFVKDEIISVLSEMDVQSKSIDDQGEKQFLIRFKNTYDQLAVHKKLKQDLSEDYSIALNLAPATPSWLINIGASPLKLGLDLRGGVRFLLDVDIDSNIAKFKTSEYAEIRKDLRREKLKYTQIIKSKNHAKIIVSNKDQALDIREYFQKNKPYFDISQSKKNEQYQIDISINDKFIENFNREILDKTAQTLRNRVNELGVAESVVQRQGNHYVSVELPGIQDTARAKQILGKTATIEFRLLHEDYADFDLNSGNLPEDSQLLFNSEGKSVLLEREVVLTGESIIGAVGQIDAQTGEPIIAVTVGGRGLSKFSKITASNVGRPLAVLYKESKLETVKIDGKNKKIPQIKQTVISVATINSALGHKFQITGFSVEKARDLSLLLRSGSLPTTISIAEEKVIGPNLGKDNVRKGIISVVTGLSLVLLMMTIYYRTFGFIANIALIANLFMLLSLMSLVGATLTLPGIAGIVLTLGMAVDASVLIFERIREEKKKALPAFACLQRGFEQAFTTIVDANLTTLIVAIILYAIGTGPVKGFAVTLSLGILTSMFTSVTVTKVLVDLLLVRNKDKIKLNIGA